MKNLKHWGFCHICFHTEALIGVSNTLTISLLSTAVYQTSKKIQVLCDVVGTADNFVLQDLLGSKNSVTFTHQFDQALLQYTSKGSESSGRDG